jgi:hypothetical protein
MPALRVVKPDPGVEPDKEPGPGFYGSTRINPGQPIKPGLCRGQVGFKIKKWKRKAIIKG